MREQTRNKILGAIFKGAYYTIFSLSRVRFSIAIRYLDFSRITANFTAPASRVQDILPSQKLKPFSATPGITLITLFAMEYRRIVNVDPFNEFAIAVPVRYATDESDESLPGYYIIQIPVTSEQARWSGVEISGFPKFIADIKFDDQVDTCRSQVWAEGKQIIMLEVKKPEIEFRSRDEYYYSLKDGRVLRTFMHVKGQAGTADIHGGASFSLGNHPIADNLRSLEISQMSVGHEYAPKLEALERPPERVGFK
jgi:hypothetical protein